MFYSSTPKQYAAYTAAHHTVNKTRQVVMLYDGAIRFVTQAKDAIERDNIQARYNALEKATAIISGMQSAIDFDNGGHIAQLLDDYYYSIYMRLMSIHRSNSAEMCTSIIQELKVMRDSWQEVDNASSNVISENKHGLSASSHTEASGMQVSI